jgi:hypothetical protein
MSRCADVPDGELPPSEEADVFAEEHHPAAHAGEHELVSGVGIGVFRHYAGDPSPEG